MGHAVQSGLVLCFPVLFLGKGAWVSTCSAPCAMRDRQESLEPASIWLIHKVNGEKMTWRIIWVRYRISRRLFLLTVLLFVIILSLVLPGVPAAGYSALSYSALSRSALELLTLLLGTTLDHFIWFVLCNLVSELHTIIYPTIVTLCCSCLKRFSTLYIMVTAFP